MSKVMIAKYLMNICPNKPKFQENHFAQEIFRHPNYTELSQDKKEALLNRLVNNNFNEAKSKPFDLFFPTYPLKKLLEGKNVLDLGCSIGGKTIYLGEEYNVNKFYGIDVSKQSIDTANLYISKQKTKAQYKFIHAYAESLPFENDYFDAIISLDTLEHVRSVIETLSECQRTLKKDGLAFIVFPSFKFPFGGAHVTSVTKTPFLEWFFSPVTINSAYQEIVSKWEADLDWFKPTEETTKGGWAAVEGGIGVNGTMYKNFLSAANKVGFNDVSFVKIPLLYVSNTAVKYPFVKFLSSFLKPLLNINFFRDYLTQRLVFVLKK